MELTNDYLEGRFLIATPGIQDPRFEQAIIYVFKHDYSGASGLIINQVSDYINFSELCNQLSFSIHGEISHHVLYNGGPVESNRGYVLHTDDFKGRDTQIFKNSGLALTTTVDIIRKLAEGEGPKKSLISLGYVGWAPGQLENEMQTNGWLYCNADQNIIFDVPHMMRWQTAVNKIGFQVNQITEHYGRA